MQTKSRALFRIESTNVLRRDFDGWLSGATVVVYRPVTDGAGGVDTAGINATHNAQRAVITRAWEESGCAPVDAQTFRCRLSGTLPCIAGYLLCEGVVRESTRQRPAAAGRGRGRGSGNRTTTGTREDLACFDLVELCSLHKPPLTEAVMRQILLEDGGLSAIEAARESLPLQTPRGSLEPHVDLSELLDDTDARHLRARSVFVGSDYERCQTMQRLCRLYPTRDARKVLFAMPVDRLKALDVRAQQSPWRLCFEPHSLLAFGVPRLRWQTQCLPWMLLPANGKTCTAAATPPTVRDAIALYESFVAVRDAKRCTFQRQWHRLVANITDDRLAAAANWLRANNVLLPSELPVVVVVTPTSQAPLEAYRLYLAGDIRAEQHIARSLAALVERSRSQAPPNLRCDTGITDELTDEQQAAVEHAAVHPITILDGPPGTGKTHVIQTMCRMFQAKETLVLTFFGRALEVLRARLNPETPTSTIHRAFYRWINERMQSTLMRQKQRALAHQKTKSGGGAHEEAAADDLSASEYNRLMAELMERQTVIQPGAAGTGHQKQKQQQQNQSSEASLQKTRDFFSSKRVVIVDEFSTLDFALFSALLYLFPNVIRIVISGDIEQIAPLGVGNSLMAIQRALPDAICRLTRNQRVSADAMQLWATREALSAGRARDIQFGQDATSDTIVWVPRGSGYEAIGTFLQSARGRSLGTSQIIALLHRHCYELGRLARAFYCPERSHPDDFKSRPVHAKHSFSSFLYVGGKIMFTLNTARASKNIDGIAIKTEDVANGQIAIIEAILLVQRSEKVRVLQQQQSEPEPEPEASGSAPPPTRKTKRGEPDDDQKAAQDMATAKRERRKSQLAELALAQIGGAQREDRVPTLGYVPRDYVRMLVLAGTNKQHAGGKRRIVCLDERCGVPPSSVAEGFAATVHSSQGDQFECVALFLGPEDSYNDCATRNTAIVACSRASKQLFVICADLHREMQTISMRLQPEADQTLVEHLNQALEPLRIIGGGGSSKRPRYVSSEEESVDSSSSSSASELELESDEEDSTRKTVRRAYDDDDDATEVVQ